MEAFGTCVHGLASAKERLVHPSAINPVELMDLFRQLAKFTNFTADACP